MDLEKAVKKWPRAVFLVDGSGLFRYRNRAMNRLDLEEAKSLSDLLESLPWELTTYLAEADPNEPCELDVRLKRGQSCRLTLLALPEEGLFLGRMRETGGSDTGALERLEEALQSIRQLGHDMCQPLTVIMGQTEIMQLTHSQDEEVNRRLEAIIKESEKLEGMTRKLSTIVRGTRQK